MSKASTARFLTIINAYIKDISTRKIDYYYKGFLSDYSVACRSNLYIGILALVLLDVNVSFIA